MIKQSYKEVYITLNQLPKELYEKIPINFINMLESEMDTEYDWNFQDNVPIHKQKLSVETLIILGLIYRDFLTDPEDRKKLQKEDAILLNDINNKLEEIKRKKYDVDNIFKKRTNQEVLPDDEVSLVNVKEKWYTKILNKIKNLFLK